MRERDVEARLVLAVKLAGGVAHKFVSPARRSVPDRIVTLPGRGSVFVELKAVGCKPTPAQQREHERIRAAGGTVHVLDSYAAVAAFVKL